MLEISADNDVARLLGHAPRRIAVAGVSCAGKSTLARRIAARLELPYCEIDSLFHGPGWVPRKEYRDLHERIAETWPDIVVVRLRSHAEAEAWLARL